MLTVLCWYFALSVAVGLVSSVVFLYGFRLGRLSLWHALMLVCPLSWLVVAAFFIAYGFYKRRSVQKGGE